MYAISSAVQVHLISANKTLIFVNLQFTEHDSLKRLKIVYEK